MVSSSSLARSKSFWRLYHYTIYSGGPRLLELGSWFVWMSMVLTIADSSVLDLFSTAEHVYR